jgi:hypothetical protein
MTRWPGRAQVAVARGGARQLRVWLGPLAEGGEPSAAGDPGTERLILLRDWWGATPSHRVPLFATRREARGVRTAKDRPRRGVSSGSERAFAFGPGSRQLRSQSQPLGACESAAGHIRHCVSWNRPAARPSYTGGLPLPREKRPPPQGERASEKRRPVQRQLTAWAAKSWL